MVAACCGLRLFTLLQQSKVCNAAALHMLSCTQAVRVFPGIQGGVAAIQGQHGLAVLGCYLAQLQLSGALCSAFLLIMGRLYTLHRVQRVPYMHHLKLMSLLLPVLQFASFWVTAATSKRALSSLCSRHASSRCPLDIWIKCKQQALLYLGGSIHSYRARSNATLQNATHQVLANRTPEEVISNY